MWGKLLCKLGIHDWVHELGDGFPPSVDRVGCRRCNGAPCRCCGERWILLHGLCERCRDMIPRTPPGALYVAKERLYVG
jgi:hypothetical protein